MIFDIKDFFDFETMFVEKFLIVDRKWISTFCDNWILQKRAIKRNVHFAETIREYKNVVKKNLKIVEHANVVTLQNQSQFQSKKSTSSICSDHHDDEDKARQCIYDCMHDWNKFDHILKSIKSSNWKCNSQKRKWAWKTIKNSRWFYFRIKNMTNIDILNEIKSKDCKNDKKKMTRKLIMRRNQKMISRMLNFLIWRIKNHLNMQIYLLTRRSTISYEKAWFTIQIIMIHSFMIWIIS